MIRQDLVVHFFGHAIVTFVLAFLMPPMDAAGIAFGIGIAKELIWDHMLKRGSADWMDAWANLLGVSLGFFLFHFALMVRDLSKEALSWVA